MAESEDEMKIPDNPQGMAKQYALEYVCPYTMEAKTPYERGMVKTLMEAWLAGFNAREANVPVIELKE